MASNYTNLNFLLIIILGIIAKQFSDLKIGDRFYFESQIQNSPFSFRIEQLKAIRNVTMANILCRNSDLKIVQKFPFFTANKYYNPLLSCNDLSSINLGLWAGDFSEKNYTVYVKIFIFILFKFIYFDLMKWISNIKKNQLRKHPMN